MVSWQGAAMLWLRWVSRDFRQRWLQLTITALVIALGTGAYAGLSSVSRWRMISNDASFELTAFHDIRIRLSAGSFVDEGVLRAALDAAAEPEVAGVVERLVVPTQVEVDGPEGPILVPGRIVGAPAGDVPVDRLFIERGRALDARDAGAPTVLLERNFGKHYGLPAEGNVTLPGGSTLQYVGQAVSPEYILVVTEESGLLAEANFGVVFTSIETAREVAGLPAATNDLVIRLQAGADRDAVAERLLPHFEPLGATIITRDEEDAYRLLVEDAKNDQQIYTVFAVAILAGAVFAGFNIISRMVEAQRREFGIAMALGVPAWRIALRPLLVGAQIAAMGVIFGVGVGLLVGWAMGEVLRGFLTMPVVKTPFQPGLFATVAIIGFVAPMLAISYPVWRAVRVPPIQAIRSGHLAVRAPGLAGVARRFPIPGNTFTRLPFRNLARAPRRALLTGLGIAAVIAVLSALLGYLDSFFEALDRAEAEAGQAHPERLEIDLDRFYVLDSETAQTVLGSKDLRNAEPRLRVGAVLMGDEAVEVFLELTDLESDTWTPTLTRGSAQRGPGIVISGVAARDLGVSVGDTLPTRHLVMTPDGEFRFTESSLPVIGIHRHPLRYLAYMDYSQAGLFGLEGMLNRVSALPASGGTDAAKRTLFDVPGVVSVQEVTASARVLRDRLGQFIGIFQVMQAALIMLAALIAFNTASINGDERRREHATMLAFGVPERVLMRSAVVEGAMLGLLATVAGLAGGYFLEQWFITVLSPRVLPDIGLKVILTWQSFATVAGLGVAAVALTPLLGWRRLRRMNLPTTLRTME